MATGLGAPARLRPPREELPRSVSELFLGPGEPPEQRQRRTRWQDRTEPEQQGLLANGARERPRPRVNLKSAEQPLWPKSGSLRITVLRES
jgi:hypothetical protein